MIRAALAICAIVLTVDAFETQRDLHRALARC